MGELAEELYDGPWIRWRDARHAVVEAGLSDWGHDPVILRDWAATGAIGTRALSLSIGAKHYTNAGIPSGWWRTAAERAHGIDYSLGSLRWEVTAGPYNAVMSCHARGIEFRADQFEAIVGSYIATDADVAEAVPATPEKRSRRGKSPDQERWKLFWFAVVDLANEGRLCPSAFQAATLLSEEILLMMGDQAFDKDYIKPTVAQIFKRFIERSA